MYYTDGSVQQHAAPYSFNPFAQVNSQLGNIHLLNISSGDTFQFTTTEPILLLLFCKEQKCTVSNENFDLLITENSCNMTYLKAGGVLHIGQDDCQLLAIRYAQKDIYDYIKAYPFFNELISGDRIWLNSRIASRSLLQSFKDIEMLPYQKEQLNQLFFNFKSRELLMHCADQFIKPVPPVINVLKTDKDFTTIFAIKKQIDEHLDSRPALPQLMKTYAINKDKLTRGFRQIYGKSILEYYQSAQMVYAAELLITTDRTINEIAALLNLFPSNFIRGFKKIHGTSPTIYRQMHNK